MSEEYSSGQLAGEVSVYSDATVKTLLKNESAFMPVRKDDNNDYRYYDDDTVKLIYAHKLMVSVPPKVNSSFAQELITEHSEHILSFAKSKIINRLSLKEVDVEFKELIKKFKLSKV